MAYTILARKYRPRTFEDMVGQKGVVRTLQNAIRTGRIAQAYLFSGMRGTGKTTTARILAKALNCAQGPTATPCNACEYCVAINEDRAIDVLEIDGASNRGIDDIKQLRESLGYKPIYTRFKVIIIDEVHQITKDGFNALLKTLEEPPPNTVFIFATTEYNKVLATIVSRCQHFEFRKISARETIDHLADLAAREKIEVTPAGLAMIAEAADGSLRDAQSILDQAVAFSGETVSDENLREILGVIGRELFFEVSSAFLDENPAAAFAVVDKLISGGHDLRAFLKKLIEHLRELLLVKSVAAPEPLIDAGPEELQSLRDQAAKATAEDFLRYLNALQQAEAGLRFSSQPRIYLEALLVRLCHFRKIVPFQELVRDVRDLQGGGGGGEAGGGGSRPGPSAAAPAAGPAAPRTSGTSSRPYGSSGPGPAPGAPFGKAPTTPPAPAPGHAPAVPPKPPAASPVPAQFQETLKILRSEKPAVAALLSDVAAVAAGEDALEIVFGARKQDFVKTVQREIKAVEAAVARAYGRTLQVRLSGQDGPVPAAAPSAAPAPPAAVPPVPRGKEAEAAVLADPGVRTFKDVFNAQVVSIDPAPRRAPAGPGPEDEEGGNG